MEERKEANLNICDVLCIRSALFHYQELCENMAINCETSKIKDYYTKEVARIEIILNEKLKIEE